MESIQKLSFKEIVNFFSNMYNNCKPNFVVTCLSIIQNTILLTLFINAIIYRKRNDIVSKMVNANLDLINPIKFDRKSFMILFISILSSIFYYITLKNLCKNGNKKIAWFLTTVIYINFFTQYLYFLALLVITGCFIFYLYRTTNNPDIEDSAAFAGLLGLVLLCIDISSKALKFFDKIKNKKNEKFWKSIHKYIKGGECNNDGDCRDIYGEGTRCNSENLCEWVNTNNNERIDVETKRIMQILGISDDSIDVPLYADLDHEHD